MEIVLILGVRLVLGLVSTVMMIVLRIVKLVTGLSVVIV